MAFRWMVVFFAVFVLGRDGVFAPLLARSISVSELNYHDGEDPNFHFIELVNISQSPVPLTGYKFVLGIDYTFTEGVLQVGQRIVVVKSRTDFQARYGNGINLAKGSFKGDFKSKGEQVTLVDAQGAEAFTFTYDNSGNWPSRPDGFFSTLECLDPAGDLDDPSNWRSSAEFRGSPGAPGVGPRKDIVINELLAHTDLPLEDAVEFYNTSTNVVDMSGWYLGESRSKPLGYRIPKKTLIQPKGFLVLYELGFNFNNPDNPFTFNSAHGGEATLISADASGKPLLWVDTQSFNASENGVSFGHWPDGVGPWVTLSDLGFGTSVRNTFPEDFITVFRKALGATNPPPRVGPLVISAIQYLPPAGQDEFLEIVNITTTNVPLFDPLYPTNGWRLRDGVDFDFPTDQWLLPGRRLIVCATNPAAFRARQNVPADALVLGPWSGALNNSGEKISLLRPDPPQGPLHPDFGFVPYVEVEEITYNDKAPWPVGSALNGFTIERRDLGAYGNHPSNWRLKLGSPKSVSLKLSRGGVGKLLASFSGEIGRIYRLESNPILSGTGWKTDSSGSLVPTGTGQVQVTIDAPANTQYYRVVVESSP